MTSQNTIVSDAAYLESVLNFYIQLPDTPVKPSTNDRLTAAAFRSNGTPLLTVHAAMLLASVRRLARPDDAAPLPPVRSLAYFSPVIRELSSEPLPDGYLKYLRDKLRRLTTP